MSSSDEKSQPGGRRVGTGGAPDDRPAARERDMGAALRSVYQRAVDEDIPDEMMDLLGKLG